MYQELIVLGNCGSDPTMRYTPSGSAVTNFSMATSRTYKKNEEQVKETTWFMVTVWQKQAEVVNEYLKKGDKVLVVGELIPDTDGNPKVFTTKDGTPKARFEIRASTVRILSKHEQTEPHQELESSEL